MDGGPQVRACLAVTAELSEKVAPHLGRDVVGGAAEGLGGHAVPHVLLTHAEVGDLDVPFRVQHHVIQLEVPVMEGR